MTKRITQPAVGLAFLTMMALACPSPMQAQETETQRPVPAVPPLPATRPAPTPNPSVVPTNPSAVPSNAPNGSIDLETTQTQAADVPPDYSLGGGDRIRITVFEVPEYTSDYQIPPGGKLFLPLVGPVDVLGLTQSEAADAIAARYARYLKRPLITVSLLSPRPINVVIAGEVNRPGSYTVGLQGGAGDNPGVQYPTIVGALTLAEGTTLAANLRQVQLRRQLGKGPGQVLTIDLTELVNTGNLATRDITLRDGDTIYVPTANEINMAEIRQFATASFAAAPSRPRSVTVVGEVSRPGSYVVIGGSTSGAATTTPGNTQGGGAGGIEASGGAGAGLPTVSRAIQLAGGITESADVRNIRIRRPTKNGSEQTMSVNFMKLLEGDTYQDTLVQEGDTIVVPKATSIDPAEAQTLADASFSPATIQVSVVGEVKNPGLVSLQPNTPLNQAILTAGGFNDSRARRSSVDLIRLNPDGTVTKRKLPIDLAKGINTQNNPILRDNDIVVVSRSGTAKVGDSIGAVFGPVLSPFLGIFNLFR